MKVLITGAGGYIGRHVVKAFLNHGHEVYVSDFSYGKSDICLLIAISDFNCCKKTAFMI